MARRHFHPSMTFPMQAQAETIHIGAFPYMPDYGAAGSESWEAANVNMAAASVYATNSGAYTFIPIVGRTAAFYPSGLKMAHISADASFTKHPYLLVFWTPRASRVASRMLLRGSSRGVCWSRFGVAGRRMCRRWMRSLSTGFSILSIIFDKREPPTLYEYTS
ncbi:hypothetical protein BDW68DRAFT_136326 [Aspergillus falconensis]